MLPADLSPSSCPGLFWKAEAALAQAAPRSRARQRLAARGSQRQPEAGKGGLSSFHGSNRKTRDCTTWKNSTHTRAHTPRHTPHTPGTTANMFRPSAGRDTRQRRAVQISRGSLVLVDSPRKKQPPEVVVAQLCKICGVFSVWQLQEGETGCLQGVLQEGEGMEVQCCVSRCAPGSAASQGVESRKRKEGS